MKNNSLTNQAYALVQCVENIDQIWTHLKAAYGDTRHMLNTKNTFNQQARSHVEITRKSCRCISKSG